MRRPSHPSADRAPPLWALALIVALGTGQLVGLLAGHLGRLPAAPSAGRAPIALGHASARELRRLPGIGETRALALVEARWRRGPGDPPLLLRDVDGIGPELERRVRTWLEREEARAALADGSR